MNKFGWSYPPGCSGPPDEPAPSPEYEEVYSLLEPFATPPFGPDGLPMEVVDRVSEIVDRLAKQAEANKECPHCLERAYAELEAAEKAYSEKENQPGDESHKEAE